ncbi:MAG: serine/threonine protein kinase [Cyanobacteria bacterium HKST-UBA02]|nr:serine/threonine protein kinase [Cyanobacteria bacterium HKST-UBA02]
MAAPDPVLGISDRYEIHEKLGEGGVGLVYKARDTVLDQWVAIKVMLLDSDRSAVRFQQEARAIGKLSHENIVRVFDFGQTGDGKLYMVSEYLDGLSLKELIRQRGSLSEAEAIPVFEQICRGLAYAHSNGVVHRDLKPANVMLLSGADGYAVKLIDFGLVKILDEDQRLTATGVGIGSPPYMSPEQVEGGEIDAATDIYSLGCLIFESLAGRPPLLGDTVIETMQMHRKTVPPALSTMTDQQISEGLEKLVAACLEKERSGRPESIDHVLQALHGPDDSVSTETSPASRRTRAPLALISIALCLALITAGVLLLSRSEKAPVASATPDESFNSMDLPLAINEGRVANSMGGGRYSLFQFADEDLRDFAREHPDAEDLQLDTSSINGPGLKYLKGLPIRYLCLDRLPINDHDFAYLGDLPGLKTIHMQNNTTMTGSGYEALSRLPEFYELKLTNSRLTEKAMESLSKIETPVRMDLTRCEFPPGSLRKLRPPHLERLYLCETKLGSLEDLKGLTCRDLLLEGNPGLALADFSCLREVEGLSSLFIDNCGVKSKGIGQLVGLRDVNWLSMTGCDVGPADLADFKSSKIYNLSVTQRGEPRDFYSSLCGWRDLHELKVEKGSLSDIGPLFRSDIESFGLINSSVSGKQLAVLDEVPGINRLIFTHCKIDGDFLKELARSRTIKALTIVETDLSERQIAQLQNLKRLKRLVIEETHIPDSDKQKIQQSLPDTEVHID